MRIGTVIISIDVPCHFSLILLGFIMFKPLKTLYFNVFHKILTVNNYVVVREGTDW